MTDLSTFAFVLTVLAVWRCVVFIRQDGLIDGTRTAVTVYLMRHGGFVNAKLLYLMQCQWCLAIWFSLFSTAALTHQYEFTYVGAVIVWLATAAAASLLDGLSDRL